MKVFDYSAYLKFGEVTVNIELSGIEVEKQVDIVNNLTSMYNYITGNTPTSEVDSYCMYCNIYDEMELPENEECDKNDGAE